VKRVVHHNSLTNTILYVRPKPYAPQPEKGAPQIHFISIVITLLITL